MNIAENDGAQHAAVQAAGDCGDPGQYGQQQFNCNFSFLKLIDKKNPLPFPGKAVNGRYVGEADALKMADG